MTSIVLHGRKFTVECRLKTIATEMKAAPVRHSNDDWRTLPCLRYGSVNNRLDLRVVGPQNLGVLSFSHLLIVRFHPMNK